MKYIEFYKKFSKYPIISLADIKNSDPDFDHRRLYEWQQKEYIKKITNNFYIFADKKVNDFEMNFISNKLYEPSYLSMEYALNFYSLIPEFVFGRTSVTTKKTKIINTGIANFSYQSIKKELFFGYKLINKNKLIYKIAELEKAILDFFYLRKDINNENDIYELRINKDIFKEEVSQEKLDKYLQVFNSTTLSKKIKLLNKHVNS